MPHCCGGFFLFNSCLIKILPFLNELWLLAFSLRTCEMFWFSAFVKLFSSLPPSCPPVWSTKGAVSLKRAWPFHFIPRKSYQIHTWLTEIIFLCSITSSCREFTTSIIAMDASHKLNAGWLWQSIAKDKEILTSIVCTTVKSKLITFSHDCRHRSKLACVVLALDQVNNLCRLSKKQLSRFPLHSSSIITSALDFSLYHGHISLKQHL